MFNHNRITTELDFNELKSTLSILAWIALRRLVGSRMKSIKCFRFTIEITGMLIIYPHYFLDYQQKYEACVFLNNFQCPA